MPPRKRANAPANRVYKSSTPLNQTKLTAPKKRIRSYGKKSGVQLPKPDNTLTQMDWLKRQQMLELEQQEEDEDEDYAVEVKKPKRKRRKTTGDVPSATPQLHTQTISQVWSINSGQEEVEQELGKEQEKQTKKSKSKRRKTAGDEPSASLQFHTQTLTQLDRSFKSAPEEEGGSIFDVPSSSQSAKLPKSVKKAPARKAKKAAIAEPPEKSPAREKSPPQTPHRILPGEIPSSQSPGTPLSIHSRGSTGRRSPLNEMSINIPIPFNTNSKPLGNPSQTPKLEVQNSSESGTHPSHFSRVPPTPSKRSSPAKSVRFALPDVEEEEDGDEDEEPTSPTINLEATPYRASQSQPSSVKSMRTEILDSDAESEEEVEVRDQLPASTAQVEEEEIIEQEAEEESELQDHTPPENDDQHAETDSCYGEIGAETQFEAERIIDSPRLSGSAPATRSPADSDSERFQERTQMMESQRLATQYIHTMAPRTASSDIFISLPPQHVLDILGRARDHIIRAYSFPPTVCRIWIVETKPVSALKYLAEIGPAKRPGQILDERGLESAKFNTRAGSWTAYEILQLYELSDPLPWAKLKANEWLNEPPKKFSRVGPAVVDQLVANLKTPLFHTEPDAPASSSTDTQEAEAQLLNTIKQFTQLGPSSPPPPQPQSTQFIKPEIANHDASSSYATPRTNGKMAPPASQATTVDLSQTQTPRQQSVVEVVWESPTRPVPSSTPLKLPTPLAEGSQSRGIDSVVLYSMASSQLLTKSQLLPNSLLEESVSGLPLFIQDSDEEEL